MYLNFIGYCLEVQPSQSIYFFLKCLPHMLSVLNQLHGFIDIMLVTSYTFVYGDSLAGSEWYWVIDWS